MKVDELSSLPQLKFNEENFLIQLLHEVHMIFPGYNFNLRKISVLFTVFFTTQRPILQVFSKNHVLYSFKMMLIILHPIGNEVTVKVNQCVTFMFRNIFSLHDIHWKQKNVILNLFLFFLHKTFMNYFHFKMCYYCLLKSVTKAVCRLLV